MSDLCGFQALAVSGGLPSEHWSYGRKTVGFCQRLPAGTYTLVLPLYAEHTTAKAALTVAGATHTPVVVPVTDVLPSSLSQIGKRAGACRCGALVAHDHCFVAVAVVWDADSSGGKNNCPSFFSNPQLFLSLDTQSDVEITVTCATRDIAFCCFLYATDGAALCYPGPAEVFRVQVVGSAVIRWFMLVLALCVPADQEQWRVQPVCEHPYGAVAGARLLHACAVVISPRDCGRG